MSSWGMVVVGINETMKKMREAIRGTINYEIMYMDDGCIG
jgi:hypothetical protein